ncbi:MAG TPA: hypothetical protein DCQ92_10400 [Verrucomicrobia subdivision 3 bacterium]|nr:hypothetical protein [Limisphaerales bacterium]
MSPYKLTIAIPTWNRNKALLRNLTELMPQLTTECELMVIDNCSDIPVETTIAGILNTYSGIKTRIIRNRYNVGGNANILRCYEQATTEWVWVMGDDDLPQKEAIERIFASIEKYPDSFCINFKVAWIVESIRTEPQRFTEMRTLLDQIGSLGELAFISAAVHKVSAYHDLFSIAYQFTNTNISHVILVLFALARQRGSVVLESSSIVVRPVPDDVINDSLLALGISNSLDLPFSGKDLLELKKALQKTERTWISFRGVIVSLLIEHCENNDNARLRIRLASVRRRYFTLGAFWKKWFYVTLAMLISISPGIASRGLGWIYRKLKPNSIKTRKMAPLNKTTY